MNPDFLDQFSLIFLKVVILRMITLRLSDKYCYLSTIATMIKTRKIDKIGTTGKNHE